MPIFTWKTGEGASSPPPEKPKVEPEAPNEHWPKHRLLDWCQEHGIDIPPGASKSEILALIKEVKA